MQRSTGCPANYHELFENYFPMIRGIVAKAGIETASVEDVAMDILCRFMERDGISWYDPNKLHDVTQLSWEGKKVGRIVDEGPRYRTATFRGMLRQFVVLSVRHHLDKQTSLAVHEPFRMEHNIGEDETPWEEVMEEKLPPPRGVPTIETIEIYDAIESAKRMRDERVEEALKVCAQKEESALAKDRKCRQHALYEARREARKAIEDANRRQRALIAATKIAMSGERVTGSSVARECGWSAPVGVRMLKNVREDLNAVGL